MNDIQGFLQDCKLRGLTRNSIQTYAGQVKAFMQVRADKKPAEMNIDDLKLFLEELRERGLSGSTIRGHFSAVSSFFDYLIFQSITVSNPVLPFRKRYLTHLVDDCENTRQLISVQDLQLLISAAEDIQQRAIIMVLAKTGMRLGELLSLHPGDLDLKRGIIRIPPKPKRTNRITFIDEELMFTLRDYLSWREKKRPSSWLWATSSGARIKREYPGMILADLGSPLGLHTKHGALGDKLTPHCMRHFFTTWLYRAGMDPEHLKWLRGDSLSSEAWQIYNHIDPEEVRQEYLRRIPKLISFDQKISMYL